MRKRVDQQDILNFPTECWAACVYRFVCDGLCADFTSRKYPDNVRLAKRREVARVNLLGEERETSNFVFTTVFASVDRREVPHL